MKYVKFGALGGYPFVQDTLAYLQQGVHETFAGFAAAYGNGPSIISGMGVTTTLYGTTYAAGWLYYNGYVVRFTGGGSGTIYVGEKAYVVLSTTSGPLTFINGTINNVLNETTATIAILPSSTPTDATHFPVDVLFPTIAAGIGGSAQISDITGNSCVVTFTTPGGMPGGTTATLFTINFGTALVGVPNVTLQGQEANSAGIVASCWPSGVTASAISVTGTVADLASATTYKWVVRWD